MYELHFLIPTANGGFMKETRICMNHIAYLDATLECESEGYVLLKNPMCENCTRLGKDCDGEANFVWTGCVYKRVAAA